MDVVLLSAVAEVGRGRFHRLGPAIGVAGVLAASSADLARRAAPVSKPAAAGLGVYAGWCSLATALSTAIWRRNR